MIEEIFKYRIVNLKKLLDYGFNQEDDSYKFITSILNNEFQLEVFIDEKGAAKTRVVDNKTQEEYVLYLVKSTTGEFVGKIREEVEKVLKDISEKCYNYQIFKGEQTREIIEYVDNNYNDKLEFLWEKSPDFAIWRRKDNKKWYALLMVLPKNKFGFDSDEMIEVLNLRADSSEVADNKNIFKAYHMNKKSWISVLLNGEIPTKEVIKLLNSSYNRANKK